MGFAGTSPEKSQVAHIIQSTTIKLTQKQIHTLKIMYNYIIIIPIPHKHTHAARSGYATEGAFFISAQQSTDAVSTLQKGLGINMTVEAA